MIGEHLPHPDPGVAVVYMDFHLHLGQQQYGWIGRLLIAWNQHATVRMSHHAHNEQKPKNPTRSFPSSLFHSDPYNNLSSEIFTKPFSVPTYTTPS